MKCYYHETRDAVANCVRCGKALCKSCASSYQPCMCDDCYILLWNQKRNEAQRQEKAEQQAYIQSRNEARRSFGISVCVGALLSLIVVSLLIRSGLNDVVAIIFYAISMFAAPFGWKTLTQLLAKGDYTVFGTIFFWLFVYSLKALISLIIGIPCMILSIVKIFVLQDYDE